MHRYSFDENSWVELDEELRDGVSNMRGDMWNDKFYMTGGLLNYGSGGSGGSDDDFSRKVQVYDLEGGHLEQFTYGGRDNIDAMGVAQCVYNSDTFISIGGVDDDNDYHNDLFILGS